MSFGRRWGLVLVLGVLSAPACDGRTRPAGTTQIAGSGGNGGVESTDGAMGGEPGAVGGEPGSEPRGGSGPSAGGTTNGGDSGEAADEAGRGGRGGSEAISGRGGSSNSSGGKTGAGGVGGNAAGAGGLGCNAAGAGGDPGPTLGITPIGLPAGRIGTPYSVELTATGAKGEVHWTVAGSLPNGLTLTDEPGTGAVISGTPSVAGPVTFRLLAEDEGGLAGVRDYDLRVRSLRWLLYSTDTDLYAVDLGTDPPGDPVRVNPSPGTFLETDFLDDQPGGPFAVLATKRRTRFWVVSFAGLSPDAPVELDGWPYFSADGRRLAYVAEPPSSEPQAFVVDMSGPVPGAPVRVSSPYGAASLLHFAGSTLYYQSTFAKPTNWLYSVDLTTLPPPEPVPVVGCANQSCPVPSPDNRHVAWFDRAESVFYVMGSRGAGPATAVPVAPELAPGGCGWMEPTWASDSRWLYFSLCPCGDTCSTYRAAIDDCGPGPVQFVAPAFSWRLSPDGARFLYENQYLHDNDPRELWVVDVSGDTPGMPRRIDGPHVPGAGFGPGLVVNYWFAPDFRHVLYLSNSLRVDVYDVLMVDVTDEPTPPLRLNPELPSNSRADWHCSPRGDAAIWKYSGPSPDLAVHGVAVTDWVPGESTTLETIATNEFDFRIDWAPDGTQVVIGVEGVNGYRLELVEFDGKAFAPSVRVGENHVIRNYRIFGPGY